MLLTCRCFDAQKDTEILFQAICDADFTEQLNIQYPTNSDAMFQAWLMNLVNRVSHAFQVITDEQDTVVGFMFSYDYRLSDQHCKVYLFLPSLLENTDGVFLFKKFILELFQKYPLHKVFIHTIESEPLAEILRQSGRQPECTLEQYSYCDGKYQNLLIWGIERNEI